MEERGKNYRRSRTVCEEESEARSYLIRFQSQRPYLLLIPFYGGHSQLERVLQAKPELNRFRLIHCFGDIDAKRGAFNKAEPTHIKT
jgi:hypothetical protein